LAGVALRRLLPGFVQHETRTLPLQRGCTHVSQSFTLFACSLALNSDEDATVGECIGQTANGCYDFGTPAGKPVNTALGTDGLVFFLPLEAGPETVARNTKAVLRVYPEFNMPLN